MTAVVIALIVIAVLVVIILARSIRIVPQARAAVVERFGRYIRTLGPGIAVLVPFIDRMRPLIDLREQVVSFPPQPVITSDNLTVAIDSVIYFQVTDPRAATYEIQNYILAVEQLTITTLRNVVGSLNLEEALTSRDGINSKLRVVLDEATGPWGIRVARVEIKAIEPPPSIRDAMEQQLRADRGKRATILTAEGARESAIRTAEGNRAAQILNAEGEKAAVILAAEADRQSAILRAQGERAAQYLRAQGEAKAIETKFNAIHDGAPDQALLAYQYLLTLPQIAAGDANKLWIVPSEFSKALEGISRLGGLVPGASDGGGGAEPTAPPAPAAPRPPSPPIDMTGWFDITPGAQVIAEAAAVSSALREPDPAPSAPFLAPTAPTLPTDPTAAGGLGASADPVEPAGAPTSTDWTNPTTSDGTETGSDGGPAER